MIKKPASALQKKEDALALVKCINSIVDAMKQRTNHALAYEKVWDRVTQIIDWKNFSAEEIVEIISPNPEAVFESLLFQGMIAPETSVQIANLMKNRDLWAWAIALQDFPDEDFLSRANGEENRALVRSVLAEFWNEDNDQSIVDMM